MPSIATDVFISYRRTDTSGHTERIVEKLRERMGRGAVFFARDSIRPGADYMDQISGFAEKLRCPVLEITSVANFPGRNRAPPVPAASRCLQQRMAG